MTMIGGVKWPDFSRAGVDSEKVLPYTHLRRAPSVFYCPYCHETWRRGGHAEGFRKAAAAMHVAICYSILLYEKGYMPYGHRRALTLEQYAKLPPIAKKQIRAIKAHIAKRKRKGLKPEVPR